MFSHRYFINFNRYRFLLIELVKRDIKIRYRRSVLGVFWSFLNPLLDTIVLTLVFSTIFNLKGGIENFPLYVLTGRLIFNLFVETTQGAMTSVSRNVGIMKTVYVPKYIFGLSSVFAGLVNFGTSLIVLVLVMFATSIHFPVHFSIYNFMGIVPLILFLPFIVGIGLILSTVTAFFRDIEYLYAGVFTTLLSYASALFYPLSMLPSNLYGIPIQWILKINPVYVAISGFREAILYAKFPNPYGLIYLFVLGVIALIVGLIIFRKFQDKFIINL
jgi:lipopolysaccharide transport system permease protein